MRYWIVPHRLFRFAETLERGLTYHVGTTLSERAVFVGEERTVLIGDEEPGGNGIDANLRSEFLSHLISHELCEVAYAYFCS